MKITVVGVFTGVSKKSNKPYQMLQCMEARELDGLRGCMAVSYFCTEEVAKKVELGKMYEANGAFGSKTISDVKAV